MDWRIKGALLALSSYAPPHVINAAYRRFSRRALKTGVQVPWEFHAQSITAAGAKRVLEFGAGKHLAQNIYLSRLGIEQTVTDIKPLASLPMVNAAIERLTGDAGVTNLAQLRDRFGIDYRAPCNPVTADFKPGQFDINITTSTLEHIPVPALRATFARLRDLRVPTISAYIDYSDHYAHTDKRVSRYNMARYPDWRWRLHNPAAHYQNRLRHGHYRDLFAQAGYMITQDEPFDPEPIPEWVRPELLRHDGFDHFTHGKFVATRA